MKNLIQIIFLFSFVFIQCKKKDERSASSLPEPTQTGANTFGAMVNGTILLPRHDPSRLKDADMVAYYNQGAVSPMVIFNIYADDEVVDPIRSIQIISKGALQQGQTYSLQESGTNPVSATYSFTTLNVYKVIPPLNGQLTVTKLDLSNHIISGTFYFDAVNASGQKASITEGRFDVKYIDH